MKKIYNILLGGIVALGLASCEENDWNKDHLDGFDSGEFNAPAQSGEFTMNSSNYSALAKALNAVFTSAEQQQQIAALKANKFFDETSYFTDVLAMPYFLASESNPYYYASVGTTVDITYNISNGTDAELGKLATATSYSVSTADYQSVWGSETDYIEGFTTSKPAASYLPGILKNNITDAASGDYAVVTYNLTQDSSTGGNGGEEEDIEITSAIKDLAKGDNLEATAIVTAQCTRGVILTDNAGSILYYNTDIDLSSYPIGTIVKVSGKIDAYNRALQLSNTANIVVVGEGEFTYPKATAYTAAMVDAACAETGNMLATFVSLEGEISISDKGFYNVIIDGASAQGSVYYATDEIKNQLVDGETQTLYGYYIAVNGSTPKYFNVLVTSVGDNTESGFNGGKVYLIANSDGDYIEVTPLNESYTYGRLSTVAATVTDGVLQTLNEANLFDFVSNGDGAFTIQDSYGRYMYNQAGYATFSVSSTLEDSNQNYWTVTDAEDNGTWIIQNVGTERYVGYSPSYKNVSANTEMTDLNLMIFNEEGQNVWSSSSPAASVASLASIKVKSRAASNTITVENAVYKYSGSSWAPAEDVLVLNPADYEGFGVGDNALGTDADTYLPLWLKNQFPYAIKGDIEYVVYDYDASSNTYSVSLYVYDGTAWNLNNDGVEEVVGRFERTGDSWTASDWEFVSYMGNEYALFEGDEIELEQSYLILGDNAYAANCLAKTYNYGYLPRAEAEVIDDHIIMPSNENAFLFTQFGVAESGPVAAPDGYFFIQDVYGRYYCMQGTYSSFNVYTTVGMTGGNVDMGFLWSATKVEGDEDNAWMIQNFRDGYDNPRTLFYTSYNNFAGYAEQSDTDVLPSLYIKLED